VTTLTGVAAVAFVALGIGPHLIGYRTLTMLSGSMRPLAAPGDLLVMRSEPTAAIRVGQVLAFTAPLPGAPVISHRVVSVEHEQDATVIRTRGDANPTEDPWRLRLDGADVWYLVGVVPAAGRFVSALHRPAIWLVSVWLLPLWICIETLRPGRRAVASPHRRHPQAPGRHGGGRHRRRRSRAGRARLLLTVPGAAIVTLVLPPASAIAGFTKVPSPPSATYSSNTLQPPSSPGGSCLRGGGPTATATVTWTASPSTFTTGYSISWTGGSTGSTTATSSPLTVPGLNKNTDYVFTIAATYNNWTSTGQVTPTISC
jgi:signal peptidase